MNSEKIKILGLRYIRKPLNHSVEAQDRTFRAHFGVGWIVSYEIWKALTAYSEHYITPRPPIKPEHLLWCLHFLKTYDTEDRAVPFCRTSRKTYRKWVWEVMERLDDLAEEKV